MSLKFMTKKSFHPKNFDNQEKVWKAEEASKVEKAKIEELRKQIEEEKNLQHLRTLNGSAGPGTQRLDWMYHDIGSVQREQDLEDYLLGKKVATLQSEAGIPQPGTLGSAVIGGSSLANGRATDSDGRTVPTSQSDIVTSSRLRDDPLFLIKQKEQQSMRAVLENPVTMARIQARQAGIKRRSSKCDSESRDSRRDKDRSHKSTRHHRHSKRDRHHQRDSNSDSDDHHRSKKRHRREKNNEEAPSKPIEAIKSVEIENGESRQRRSRWDCDDRLNDKGDVMQISKSEEQSSQIKANHVETPSYLVSKSQPVGRQLHSYSNSKKSFHSSSNSNSYSNKKSVRDMTDEERAAALAAMSEGGIRREQERSESLLRAAKEKGKELVEAASAALASVNGDGYMMHMKQSAFGMDSGIGLQERMSRSKHYTIKNNNE